MKLLVCGSRHFNDYEKLKLVLDGIRPASIISGHAKGADSLAERYAEENHVPCEVFPADWDTYGKKAGPIRNYQMLKEGRPDQVVAFLAPDSRGTKHMIEIAQKAGVETKIVEI